MLRDFAGGAITARPTGAATIDESTFRAAAAANAAFQAQLDLTARYGFTAFHQGSVVRFDDGTVVTAGMYSREREWAVVLQAQGPHHGTYTIRPAMSEGALSAVQVLTTNGWAMLDFATGEFTSDDFHQSCSYGNCLIGALYFWMEEDDWWSFVWDACDYCFNEPLVAEEMCPVCAVTLGAPALASAANCAIDSCDLCYDDDCTASGVVGQRCVTGVGPTGAAMINTVRQATCENEKEQDSQCTWVDTDQIVSQCEFGCAPIAEGDTVSRACGQIACTTDADCPPDQPTGLQACSIGLGGYAWLGQETRYSSCGTSGVCESGVVWPLGSVCIPGCNATGTGCFTGCPAPELLYPSQKRVRVDQWVTINQWSCAQNSDGSWLTKKPYRTYTPREVQPGFYTCDWSDAYVAESCEGTCSAGVCQPVTPTATATASATATATATRTPTPMRTAATHTPTPQRSATATPEPRYTVSGSAYEAVSADAYQPCANCAIRITGIGGTWTTTTSSSGAYSFTGIRAGNFAVERQCRERQEAQFVLVWEPANAPFENPSLAKANINVPRSSSDDILLPKCPASTTGGR